MGKGAKIAIGCFAVVALVGLGIGAVVMGGAWWAKGKLEKIGASAKRLEDLRAKANRVPFTRPADGVISEVQLQHFLEIRKDVYTFYMQHKDESDALAKKKTADLSDVASGMGLMRDIFETRAESQARVGMSDAEYAFLVESVYRSAWASEVSKGNDGKTPSEIVGAGFDKALDAAGQAQKELAEKQAAGQEPGSSEEAQRQIREGISKLKEGAPQARQAAKALDVPPANLALFRKYEADIKKYSMGGLEAVGL